MITSLRLQHIRNYTDAQFEFDGGVTIIVGPNGSGKTSLVEGLYVVCTGKSFRSADEAMLRHGSDWSRIDAFFSSGKERTVKYVQQQDAISKTYVLDAVEKKRLLAAARLPVVLFEPKDMSILTGEPQARRELLDEVLTKTIPHYETSLKQYKRILAQRNALLKSAHPNKKTELFVWDLRLSEYGGVIHEARKKYVEAIADALPVSYERITGKKEDVSALYQNDSTGGDYAETMLKRLALQYDKDVLRGFTSVGPHRDDLVLYIRGEDVRVTASRGETRSLLLSLKLIEITHLEAVLQQKPLILLDDVFSELDGARRQALASALAGYQAFITTTDADLVVDHFSNKAHIIALS
jgi:DNA replication and repair protein RecF